MIESPAREKQEMRELIAAVKSHLAIEYPADLYYTGWWDGFYHASEQKPVYYKDTNGNPTKSMAHYSYADIRFLDEDATVENMIGMVRNHWTR